MRVIHLTAAITLISLSALSLPVQANETNSEEHNWMPKQPVNRYWQAPDWSNFNYSTNQPPSRIPVTQTENTAPPAPVAPQAQAYRPPQQANRYQAPRPQYRAPNQYQRGNTGMRQPAPVQARPPVARPPATRAPDSRAPVTRQPVARQPVAPNNYRGYPPPPRGPYQGGYRRDNGASAYNMPGYNRYRNNNGFNNNKFWGRSGPNRWMNPNKNNMEQGWDDMINAPSRMGNMPGGWTAPEVSMPNPIDMGDQMQDNVKDLPEQIRNMDVGN